jgi:hypothetical protein
MPTARSACGSTRCPAWKPTWAPGASPPVWRRSTRHRINAEAGCDNVYRQVEPGAFAGSTIEQECRNNWRGAAYMRSISSVHAGGFTNWDRGFTAEGEHVWGPRTGGYEFTKLADL